MGTSEYGVCVWGRGWLLFVRRRLDEGAATGESESKYGADFLMEELVDVGAVVERTHARLYNDDADDDDNIFICV